MPKQRVVIVVPAGAQTLDIAGPIEVFDAVNRHLKEDGERGYLIEFVSTDGPLVRTSSGMVIEAGPLTAGQGPIGTLLVPGGLRLGAALRNDDLIAWIAEAARRSERVVSVCGGAFLLAEAGLLRGRRATTHWAHCQDLARRYPDVTVDAERIFVRDGPFVTSAGVAAGIDTALALVEADHGAPFALELARFLVLFFKRSGGQSQFSAVLDAQLADRQPIREVQEWIQRNLEQPLRVPDLAEYAGLSARHFVRVFRREAGMPPGQYIERLRIAQARELLESTELSVRQVARRCGFGTPETFFRAFGRVMGLPPGEYRRELQKLSRTEFVVTLGEGEA